MTMKLVTDPVEIERLNKMFEEHVDKPRRQKRVAKMLYVTGGLVLLVLLVVAALMLYHANLPENYGPW